MSIQLCSRHKTPSEKRLSAKPDPSNKLLCMITILPLCSRQNPPSAKPPCRQNQIPKLLNESFSSDFFSSKKSKRKEEKKQRKQRDREKLETSAKIVCDNTTTLRNQRRQLLLCLLPSLYACAPNPKMD
jgi:hypothetical protein